MAIRLNLALSSGAVTLPATGQIAVMRPRTHHDLGALPRDRVHVIQGFYPDHQHFLNSGYKTDILLGETYCAALIFLPRSKADQHALVAQAMAATGGGPVILDGQKTDGIDSILCICRKMGATTGQVISKAHGKIFSMTGGDFAAWENPPDTDLAGGFITRAGMFSADHVDPASALLVANLPAKLSGKIADLGAGWGFLAHHIMQRPAARECHLIEADHTALECARLNVPDPRASFHWDDATTFSSVTDFDHVVMNPPFHIGRAADPQLGRDFVAAGARLLRPNGTLWLVANKHLPYETSLAAAFADTSKLADDGAFKVLRAKRPLKRN